MSSHVRITILGSGTSSGVPMIACDCAVCTSTNPKDNRLRSSILIQSDTTSIVIDTTPDFRYQMLREKIKRLDAVVYTHPHKDHVAGLDDIRAFNFFQRSSINVFANTLTQEAIRREFSYIFSDQKYEGLPKINLNTIDKQKFQVGDIMLIPISVWHLHMPVLGFRIGDFTYITDANSIEDSEKEKIRGTRILLINALRKEKHLSHFTLAEAGALADELNIEETYFTHVSHQMGLHAEVNASLAANRALAYDGQYFDIGLPGERMI